MLGGLAVLVLYELVSPALEEVAVEDAAVVQGGGVVEGSPALLVLRLHQHKVKRPIDATELKYFY